MRLFAAMAALLLATPVIAEPNWLSPEDFATKVTGRATQIFTPDGALYGTEYFLPKQRTIWQPVGDTQCYFGAWTARDGLICYRYEGGAGSCIRYYQAGDTLVSVDWIGKVQTATSYNLTVVNEAPPICSGG